ncbi:hypothetical protein [Streptomyces netropsis]|uniref:Uncharacterized protein n=1 Tax=Streptomyces netropsis TaxID=55404 RepID=A0A7W7PHL3_STRNE|nr:hypothetical protein [Streptomyces netropsis]MBB4890087.1 hypothetical protein [Streptomyces netropsis]GGR43197.1 hypothetical protein GCM10010219_55930 [Streptomyces netropsis]
MASMPAEPAQGFPAASGPDLALVITAALAVGYVLGATTKIDQVMTEVAVSLLGWCVIQIRRL